MIVYPAIDIREGQVVRLRQGDPLQQTIYGNDPVEVAQRWQAAGSTHVHVVNLDGALDGNSQIWQIVEQITRLGLVVQLGGGLRSKSDVHQALQSGVSRAVIGTAAVEKPDLMRELVAEYGAEAIVVALDARHGKVATHGWQTESAWTALELGNHMVAQGVRHALYTDISRDGELEGVNVEATQKLAQETGLAVIASGGVRSLEDIKALAGGAVAGIILGKALYEGLIDLSTALELAHQI